MKIETRLMKYCWRVMLIAGVFLILTIRYPIFAQNSTLSSMDNSLKVDLIFALDNSGSMIRNDPQFITRQVVTDYVMNLNQNFRIGMVVFDKDAVLVEPLTVLDSPERKETFLGSLDRIDYSGQFTNTPAGVERAIYELKTEGRNNAEKVIVLLTDGIIDTGNKERDIEGEKWLKENLSMESKKAGIRIFGVAFTDRADFRLMQLLAIQTNGEYFRAFTTEDIQTIFNKIEQTISKQKQPFEEKNHDVLTDSEPTLIEQTSRVQLPDTPPENKPRTPKTILFSILLPGLVLVVIIFVSLVALRKKKAVIIKADALSNISTDQRESDMPSTPAELIDANNIVTNTSVSLPLPLDNKVVRIGRDASNEIVIPRRSISSFHATIEYKNGYYYLEDHRSTNGTKLNGKLIRQNSPIRLKSGDTIHFADCEFRFLEPETAPYGETVMIKRDRVK